MNKNLELLKQVDFKPLNPYDVKLLKKVLEDFEKRIDILQEYTYRTSIGTEIVYPNQTGGVDDIIIKKGDD